MPPIDTTALTAIFAWVWKEYGKEITTRTLKAAWERLRWEDRALAYSRKVQRLYGTMQILGQAKPVPLEGIFTAVSLLDRPSAWRRYTVEELEEEFAGRDSRYFDGDKEADRRDGLAMVRGGENLFIMGNPGAGKTTFLKYLALKGVSGELERVPIFIGLKQLAGSNLAVFDYVVREFNVCDFPDAAAYLDRLLRSGKAILLFDGLDEVNVNDDERVRLISDVEDFTRKYDQCQRLITCRLAADEYGFQNSPYTFVEMADFNEGQIREFVAKWFSGDTQQRERRDLFLAELEKDENEGLRELARPPLLLALLCLGFEDKFKLSSRRVELYKEALEALLRKWDSSRNIKRDEIYRELSSKRKEQMLAQVADETFARAEYFISEKTLVQSFETFLARTPNAPEEIDGEAILRAIIAQHGLFIERARGVYSFAHLTFQEYFAARYIVDFQEKGTLSQLVEQYGDPRYGEVFLLTAAQLPDATEFFSLFIERLAADAQKHPAVAALLRQIARQAATAGGATLRPAAARVSYLFLALARDLYRARARSRDLTLALALALGLGLDTTLVLPLFLAPDLDRALNHALDFAPILAHSPHQQLARDIAVVNARLLINLSILWSKRDNKEAELYLAAGTELLRAAHTQGMAMGDVITDLAFPDLTEEDWEKVSHYLDGNQLLLDCLEQAVVADREAIKDRLLLLPPE